MASDVVQTGLFVNAFGERAVQPILEALATERAARRGVEWEKAICAHVDRVLERIAQEPESEQSALRVLVECLEPTDQRLSAVATETLASLLSGEPVSSEIPSILDDRAFLFVVSSRRDSKEAHLLALRSFSELDAHASTPHGWLSQSTWRMLAPHTPSPKPWQSWTHAERLRRAVVGAITRSRWPAEEFAAIDGRAAFAGACDLLKRNSYGRELLQVVAGSKVFSKKQRDIAERALR